MLILLVSIIHDLATVPRYLPLSRSKGSMLLQTALPGTFYQVLIILPTCSTPRYPPLVSLLTWPCLLRLIVVLDNYCTSIRSSEQSGGQRTIWDTVTFGNLISQHFAVFWG